MIFPLSSLTAFCTVLILAGSRRFGHAFVIRYRQLLGGTVARVTCRLITDKDCSIERCYWFLNCSTSLMSAVLAYERYLKVQILRPFDHVVISYWWGSSLQRIFVFSMCLSRRDL